MKLRCNLPGSIFCLVMVAAWEAVAEMRLVSPRLFPSFSTIVSQFVDCTLSGALPLALWETLCRMAAGLLAATLVMIPFGIWAGRSRFVWTVIAPTVEGFRSLPPALIILPAMLVLGIGDAMKMFAVFFAASFPLLLNTMDGVRSIPSLFIDSGRILGIGRWRMLFGIILPAALPGVFSGLNTALPIAFIVAILSEMVGGTDGIGNYLMRSQRTFDITKAYAAILGTAIVGVLLSYILHAIASRCLVWHHRWKRISENHSY